MARPTITPSGKGGRVYLRSSIGRAIFGSRTQLSTYGLVMIAVSCGRQEITSRCIWALAEVASEAERERRVSGSMSAFTLSGMEANGFCRVRLYQGKFSSTHSFAPDKEEVSFMSAVARIAKSKSIDSGRGGRQPIHFFFEKSSVWVLKSDCSL